MNLRERWVALGRVPAVRTGLFVLGCLLLLLTPVVGLLPGPGGVLVFGAGAALVLKYSEWAKRHYVRFKRRHPRYAAWADWGLRRRSARQREERKRRLASCEAARKARQRELARVKREDGQAQLVLVHHEVAISYFIERRFAPDGPFVHESYWAAIGFSGPYSNLDEARAAGLRELERV